MPSSYVGSPMVPLPGAQAPKCSQMPKWEAKAVRKRLPRPVPLLMNSSELVFVLPPTGIFSASYFPAQNSFLAKNRPPTAEDKNDKKPGSESCRGVKYLSIGDFAVFSFCVWLEPHLYGGCCPRSRPSRPIASFRCRPGRCSAEDHVGA